MSINLKEDNLKVVREEKVDDVSLDSNKEPMGGLYGWICPKCGAVMSPFQDYCVKCTDLSIKFTWNNSIGKKDW